MAVIIPDEVAPEIEAEENGKSRKMDEEIRIISGILRDLSDLEEDARIRVMSYLSDRFKRA